jgi:hypothetical protein
VAVWAAGLVALALAALAVPAMIPAAIVADVTASSTQRAARAARVWSVADLTEGLSFRCWLPAASPAVQDA